jgi:hypothetical protein
MAYQTEPTRLTARSSRSILAVVVVVAVGIAVAVGGLTSLDRSAAVASPQATGQAAGPLAVASRASSGTPPATPTPTAGPTTASTAAPTARLPATMACHGIDGRRCAALARAAETAVRELGDPALPPPASVDVWAVLLCGSTFDCPPQRLVGHRPAGSVVVGFGGSIADVWINVTERERPLTGAASGRLEAWVIRSGPS